jgi:LemA protein
MQKENFYIAIIILIIAIIVSVVGLMSLYNGIVQERNSVEKSWSDVQSAYERRLGTIENFVSTAQFSAEFQLKLATEYAKARQAIAAAGAEKNPTLLDQKANEVFTPLSLSVQMEAVPEAKTEQLTELNAEIDSVERVINNQRDRYNEAVRNYNNAIETMPGSWFAKMWGFYPREGFVSSPGAEKNVKVSFSDLK